MKTGLWLPASIVAAVSCAGPARAVDGVIEINQARALAGKVTPTDDPGFPVTVDASGSYRLTGDLGVTGNGVHAIEVTSAAHDVTLDLNGFTIDGPPECNGVGVPPARGIFASEIGPTVQIRNGSVRGFCNGIYIAGRAAIASVHVSGALASGIIVGSYSLITDSFAEGNGSNGIEVGGASIVRGCDVNGNTGRGIYGAVSTLYSGNIVNGNHNFGIYATDGSTVTGNNVNDNQVGIYAQNGTTVLDNTIRSNSINGIVFSGTDNGYGRNVLTNNGGSQIFGTATQLAPNACGTALCP
jgi:hypothetical protein